jgi:hypothetical protein
LNQKDINHLNSLIICTELETIIVSWQKRAQDLMDSWQNFIFKELTSIHLKLLQEIEREGTLPNSFYEASITFILTPNKDVEKRIITKIFNVYRCKYSQQNTDKQNSKTY